jgi:glycogen debranching enzyme
MAHRQRPSLHDFVTLVAAPTQAWSGRDGAIDPRSGVPGVLHADVRVLSALEFTIDGQPAAHLSTSATSNHARFIYALPGLASVELELDRDVRPGRLIERLTIRSVLDHPIDCVVELRLAADLAPLELIRVGDARDPRAPGDGGWTDGTVTARLVADGATVVSDVDSVTVSWPITVPSRGRTAVRWELQLHDRGAVVSSAAPGPPVPELVDRALRLAGSAAEQDRRLRPWVERSLADLNGLRMVLPEAPTSAFYAAGAPWYLTLFGRDSLLAARMMLAVDPAMAVGTLQTLARLQAEAVDDEACSEPGKILHELRRGTLALNDISLPPLYYGTIDATPLWVCLLHDLWRAGADAQTVRKLLPTLQRALDWLVSYGDADGDGFLEYLDRSGHGLSNQGWKDSSDAVRFADGRRAEGPVALCEVQGYAYEAARGGADLLDAFGIAGGDVHRSWAEGLAARFRSSFWCERSGRRFPALALDGRKQRVDSLTSNIGHLLGTGLLDAEEERTIAMLVSGPELDSGLGLRTMSATDRGYAPLSYHCGSVWPHDTAMVIAGLVRCGRASYARGLVDGLLEASVAFDQQLPELWSGEGRPMPYPMACRPQAWAAAAVVPVLVALGQLSS